MNFEPIKDYPGVPRTLTEQVAWEMMDDPDERVQKLMFNNPAFQELKDEWDRAIERAVLVQSNGTTGLAGS